MNPVETARQKYRPDRITVLFVGESAPVSGDFFYYGKKTGLERLFQTAIEGTASDGPAFLERFKARGWYLDDLSLVPVNDLDHNSDARSKACAVARPGLARRIADYQPRVVVVIQKSIAKERRGGSQSLWLRCNGLRVAVPAALPPEAVDDRVKGHPAVAADERGG